MRRTKDILLEIEDVATFYQYLYLKPEHNIVVNNGLTDLKYELSDNLCTMKTNLKYPEFGASHDALDLTNILGIIDYLKTVPAVEYPDCFKNRWQEIKEITKSTLALNFVTGRNSKGGTNFYE